MRRSLCSPAPARALLAGVAVWSVIAGIGIAARGEDGAAELDAAGVAADASTAEFPSQTVARAELAAPAAFLGGLPLRRLDALVRSPDRLRSSDSKRAARLASPSRTGLEWQEWQRPEGSITATSESSRVATPEPLVSPVLVALESERSELLRTLRPERLPLGDCHRDIFVERPRPVDPRVQALFALGQNIFHRELRKYFRDDLKERFRDDPSFTQEDYQARRDIIGQLGKGGRPEDLIIEEQAAEIRNEYLDASYQDPEQDIPLLQWGPIVIDDRGGMNVDVTRLEEDRPLDRYDIELAPGDEAYGRRLGESVLFPGDRYEVSSKVKLNPDLREIGRDWEQAIGKLSASVEIDWRAPVLDRRSFTTEIGGSLDADGRYGLYLNLIIYSH